VFVPEKIPEHLHELEESELILWIEPLDGINCFIANDTAGVTIIVGVSYRGQPVFGVIHHPFDI
jgi:3'-phosphoadenosine 5'-phosphosulfate (PAPS) 3'-phosphatase